MFLVATTISLRRRRRLRAPDPDRAAHARPDDHGRDDLQPHVHAPRRGHDLPVHDPRHPERLRELPRADHARGEGRRLPAAQPALASTCTSLGAVDRALRDGPRRRGHRLDLLHAVLDDHHHQGRPDPARRLRPRVLVDPHRPELHRDDAHHAGARASPGTGCRSSSGRSTPPAIIQILATPVLGHDAPAGRRSSTPSAGASSIPPAAATRCSSSTSSGSTRTRPSTSWCCRPWR